MPKPRKKRSRLGQAMRRKTRGAQVQATDLEDEPPSVVAEIHNCITQAQDILGRSYFRPSAIGGCKREAFYSYLKFAKGSQKIDSRLQLILDNGTAGHGVMQKWMGTSTRFYIAMEVHVWVPKLEVFGHVDAVLIDRRTMYRFAVELKTMNNAGFNKLTKAKDNHVWQANLYTGLLGLKWFIVVYYNKDNQTLREFKYRFDQAMFDEGMEWCDEIRADIEEDALPPFVKSTCNEQFCRYTRQCVTDGR